MMRPECTQAKSRSCRIMQNPTRESLVYQARSRVEQGCTASNTSDAVFFYRGGNSRIDVLVNSLI